MANYNPKIPQDKQRALLRHAKLWAKAEYLAKENNAQKLSEELKGKVAVDTLRRLARGGTNGQYSIPLELKEGILSRLKLSKKAYSRMKEMKAEKIATKIGVNKMTVYKWRNKFRVY